jgi:hypothetical protein
MTLPEAKIFGKQEKLPDKLGSLLGIGYCCKCK